MSRNKNLFFILVPVTLIIQVLVFQSTDINMQIGLALGHLFLLYVGIFFVQSESNRNGFLYFTGYLILFLLVSVGYSQNGILLILFSLLYASTYQSPLLFGYFWIFILSYIVFPLYAFSEFVFGILIYTGVYTIRRNRQGQLVSLYFIWGSLLIAFLLMPLLHLFSQRTPQDIAKTWNTSPDVRDAIWLSLKTATFSSFIVALFGVPFAYAMSRARFAGKSMLMSFVDIPILVPQPIIALALLQFVGEKTTLGRFINDQFGIQFPGAVPGIIAAQVFVSAPFFIRAAMTAFQEVDARLENVARTLGASAFQSFRLITLPLASRGLFAGWILSWSRAISEFGSVLILAEYPETAPVMIYHLFIRHGLYEKTLPAVVLLALVCLWAFIGLHVIRGFWGRGLEGEKSFG